MKQPGRNPNIKPLIITNLIFLIFVFIVIFGNFVVTVAFGVVVADEVKFEVEVASTSNSGLLVSSTVEFFNILSQCDLANIN